MTLIEIVNELKAIAMTQPNIRSAGEGNIYDYMNGNPSSKYSVFFISQTVHREDENFAYYGFNLFHINRLDSTLENNRLQEQSIAKDVLSNIVKTFCVLHDANVESLVYHTFTEKFKDLTCGMYATVEFQIPLDYLCEEDY